MEKNVYNESGQAKNNSTVLLIDADGLSHYTAYLAYGLSKHKKIILPANPIIPRWPWPMPKSPSASQDVEFRTGDLPRRYETHFNGPEARLRLDARLARIWHP